MGRGLAVKGRRGLKEFPRWKIAETALNGRSTRLSRPICDKFDYSPGGLRGRLHENSKRQLCSLSYEFCTNLYAGKGFEEGGRGGGDDEYRSIVFGKNWQRRDLRGSRKDYSVDGDERSCENVLNDWSSFSLSLPCFMCVLYCKINEIWFHSDSIR